MSKTDVEKISHQLVGAFGERAVEAELLRRGWRPANVNPTIKNAAEFDIYALKATRTVHLRVKTCGPDQAGFQFGGFKPGEEIAVSGFSKTDFTILVRMGSDRSGDQFYILPTAVVRKQISRNRQQYLATRKKDGGIRKDTGHWTLYFTELRSGEVRPSYGLERRWVGRLDNWKLLDGGAK